jgi:hypothetical protein
VAPLGVVEQAGDGGGDAASPGVTSSPVSPSATMSLIPPTSLATTGRPQPPASIRTVGRFSP